MEWPGPKLASGCSPKLSENVAEKLGKIELGRPAKSIAEGGADASASAHLDTP